MLGWMKHKLESRLLGGISITSDMKMSPPLKAEIKQELKSLLLKVKESEKVGLKLQFSSVAQSCLTLECVRPRESQHARPPCQHHLPEFTQTHIHPVRDAIQPSHPRSSPSPPVPNPSQHQGLFQ